MAGKHKMSPEARAASAQRMKQMWAEIKAGKRPDPREAARQARESKANKANGQVTSQPTVAKVVAKPTPPAQPRVATVGEPQGPRTVEPSPAIIALFKSGSVYVLRINDIKYNSIGAAIGRALTDGTSIVVVTPTDTRMFDLKPTGGSGATRASTKLDRVGVGQGEGAGALAPEDQADADEFDNDPQAAAQRLALEAEASARSVGAEDTQDLDNQLATAETPADRRKALKAIRDAEGSSTNNSICGRCRGAGQIAVALESGGVVDQACPVCRGQGSIRRYGSR